ncbi:hypothetical protein [Salinimicrobium gaetbulicola]|uniref:DUF4175 family protein n=1 Tax=Salinimicrobium gaetbulicola TaxID=999702 RepID=A0ABW3IH30_9FLAO
MKGLILFIAIGLLYFLLTLFIEHIFWLDQTGRSILFWAFILVEVFLFGRFIVYPLLKMFRISKGIDHTEASKIIGNHFPEVSDKLLNVLQLKNSSRQTELLLAGIDQKAKELRPVPFSMAIDLKKNLPYLKYAAIPIFILGLLFISGREEVISGSYERVVHYKTAYEPPSPFYFNLKDQNLKVRENESLTINVMTEGEVVPENVSINYLGQTYFLTRISPGVFKYTFDNISESFQFNLFGNKVVSKPYFVEVVNVPRIRNLKMELLFPKHTGLQNKVIQGTGDAIVPEGTKVEWYVQTSSTEEVNLKLPDSLVSFEREGDNFYIGKRVFDNLNYEISTSNREVQDFENLAFQMRVVKDEFPKLSLEHKIDSLEQEDHYFYGKFSDDYGISRVRMIAYTLEEPKNSIVRQIPTGKGAVGEFLSVFPDTIQLQRGLEYQIYFEVTDNDVLNGYKSTKSSVFSYKRKTLEEEKIDRLENQQESIKALDESIKELKLSEKELEKLNRLQNERSELNFNDRKRLEKFLKRQKQQNKIMESYTDKLKKTLEEEENSFNEELKQDLQERLENREEELKENEELLKELEKYSEKIQEEGLSEKLEELSKGAKTREKNLEQLLELTKRYYVQEKLQQISQDLQKLADKQEELSKEDSETSQTQDSLSNETEKALEELKKLSDENEGLKKPMELGRNEDSEKEIPQDQKNASEDIKNGKPKDANQKQKDASQKMKSLSSEMKKQMQMGGMEQMQEDADMLRQILDNLITFSFEQEELMEAFRKMGQNSPTFSSSLKRQNVLREHFEHIDDSLFSLALRNPMITETINSKLGDIDYNIDQALKRLSQSEIRGGVGSQQYVITGANDLAYLLSSVLGNMEQMMAQAMGKGKGGDGKGMQLPDIIQKQKGLNEQMQKGVEKGEREGEGPEGSKGESEESSEELFRIFQEQQLLRKALEERLKEEGRSGSGKIQKEMEQIEKQLLEKGFDRKTYERMKRLEHNLLDLEDAEIEQGEKPERESNRGKEGFENKTKVQIIKAKEYFNTTEILNRQSLPLRQIYRQKVKHYFERGDH